MTDKELGLREILGKMRDFRMCQKFGKILDKGSKTRSKRGESMVKI